MIFQPTYLYIKQHAITGKCYFGKTIKDPVKYRGSGKRWQRHIKAHGVKHVETLWYKLFTDQEECTRVALLFSEQQDIVKSDRWLNFRPENGIDGMPPGTKLGPQSVEHRAKLSIVQKDREFSIDHCQNISIGKKGKKLPSFTRKHCQNISLSTKGKKHKLLSAEDCNKHSIALKGKKQCQITCPHCKKTGGISSMKRWHFDNCQKGKIHA
jgi:hypothetical protein